MKKMILFTLALLMTVGVMAQKQGYFLVYNIPTSTTPTTEYIKKGSYVMIMNDTTLYLSKMNIGRGSTMAATLLASASNYAIINRAIFGGKAITFFVDTANAQNIYGVKSFKNNASFAGTVGVTGNFAVNTNKFTVAATDGSTVVAGALSSTGNFRVNTNKFIVTASSGNTQIAGNAAVGGTFEATGAAAFFGKLTGSDTLQGSVLKSTGMMLSTGDFKVNTNKFTVAASSGNTTIAGTLGVTGVITPTTHILPALTETSNLGSSEKKFDLLYCNSVTTGNVATNGVSSGYVTLSAAVDTTTKTAGKIVYIGNKFYGCNGTYFYRLDNSPNK